MRLLLRVFYALLYHRFAWTYDWVAALVSCGKWQAWVRTALPYLPGPMVLELGYGPGHLQKLLRDAGKLAFGIDASREMSRLARHNLLRERYPSRLIIGYAQSLAFPDGTFDQIVATFPTRYIVEPDTLSEVGRVLKPDGDLVILAGGLPTGKKACQRLSAWLFRLSGQRPQIDEASLLEPFINAGFEAECVTKETLESKLWFILAQKKL